MALMAITIGRKNQKKRLAFYTFSVLFFSLVDFGDSIVVVVLLFLRVDREFEGAVAPTRASLARSFACPPAFFLFLFLAAKGGRLFILLSSSIRYLCHLSLSLW